MHSHGQGNWHPGQLGYLTGKTRKGQEVIARPVLTRGEGSKAKRGCTHADGHCFLCCGYVSSKKARLVSGLLGSSEREGLTVWADISRLRLPLRATQGSLQKHSMKLQPKDGTAE